MQFAAVRQRESPFTGINDPTVLNFKIVADLMESTSRARICSVGLGVDFDLRFTFLQQ